MSRALLIALALISARATADCMDWSWKVWPPPDTTLPTNGRIVLQGMGLAQKAVAHLAERNPRLKAKSPDPLTFAPPVRLKVVEVHVGEMLITQVVLQPERLLIPGTTYTLVFDQPGDEVEFTEGMYLRGAPRWIAGAQADRAAPTWLEPPTARPGHFKQMGCGPIEEAKVQLAVKDEGPVLVLARVQGATGGVREYLLTPLEGELAVGHSMCLGAFRLGDGEWTLELVALDAAGNATPAPGGPLRFKGLEPKKEASSSGGPR